MNHNEGWTKEYIDAVNNPLFKVFRIFRIRDLKIAKYLKKDDKILDAGCGTGVTLDKLNERGFKNLYGCDIEPLTNKHQIKNCSITNLEYPDNYFDGIIVKWS